jgi:hypothetical protein
MSDEISLSEFLKNFDPKSKPKDKGKGKTTLTAADLPRADIPKSRVRTFIKEPSNSVSSKY